MKEERLEILRMVAEKIISAEEGERLLHALEKGEEKAKEKAYERCGPRHRASWEASWGERFGEVGSRMQDFFENAFGSVFGDEYWFEGYEAVKTAAEEIELDKETSVVISNPAHLYKSSSADIKIAPSPDGGLHVYSGKKDSFEVLRKEKGKKILILCKDDSMIQVPQNIAKLKIVLSRGDTQISDLAVPLEVRSVKGDIRLRQVLEPLSIRSVDGNIEFDLADDYSGKSEIASMHGDIKVTLCRSFSGRIETRVGRGDIEIQSKNVKTTSARSAFLRTESVDIGDGDRNNVLSLKTMSGDIKVASRE